MCRMPALHEKGTRRWYSPVHGNTDPRRIRRDLYAHRHFHQRRRQEKAKKAALQKSTDKPAAPGTPAAEQPEFHYTEMTGDSKKDNTDASATAKFCPHCGAPNALNSQFCGSCGQKMK